MTHAEASSLLTRRRLPAGFERSRVTLAPGESRVTSAAEWSGAIVFVRAGTIEVECMGGGRATFAAGDILSLGWLPLRRLSNPGSRVARLVAIRRGA